MTLKEHLVIRGSGLYIFLAPSRGTDWFISCVLEAIELKKRRNRS
jgi:hypothetical protein